MTCSKAPGTTTLALGERSAPDDKEKSKLTKNSKNPIIPIVPSTCAIVAMTAPKRTQHESSIGPKNSETRKRISKTAAFHTIGPRDTTPMRMRGLGWLCPATGNDLTNMYAMIRRMAKKMGKRTSETMTARQPARGTSPDSFSDGRPSFFFLYPVIIVRDSRQYPIQELLCERELPRDIQRKNSLLKRNLPVNTST